MDFTEIMYFCFKSFLLLRQLHIVTRLTPNALAAAVCETYSTVSPVSMFVTKTALDLAAGPAAKPAKDVSRLAGSCQFFFLDSLILARVASEWRDPNRDPAVDKILYSPLK
jgi:hypothetical protein